MAACHLTFDLIEHQQTSLREIFEASDEDVRLERGQKVKADLEAVAEKVTRRMSEKFKSDDESKKQRKR